MEEVQVMQTRLADEARQRTNLNMDPQGQLPRQQLQQAIVQPHSESLPITQTTHYIDRSSRDIQEQGQGEENQIQHTSQEGRSEAQTTPIAINIYIPKVRY